MIIEKSKAYKKAIKEIPKDIQRRAIKDIEKRANEKTE